MSTELLVVCHMTVLLLSCTSFAKAMETFTNSYKNVSVVVAGMKINCSCGYPENEREPKYLKEVLGDNNVERVIADMYLRRTHWFWKYLEDDRWHPCRIF